MSSGAAWIRHLRQRRGKTILRQALRMYTFHRTPFEVIIDNILGVLERYDASFTFPIVASVAAQKPELLAKIIDARSEIAVHGYNHVKYPLVTFEQQESDLKRAVKTFRNLKIKVKGFRAPYNAYDLHTAEIIEKLGFDWDAGLGYRIENRSKTDFFHFRIDNREFNFACAPLCELTDDMMIDERGYTNEQMFSLLKQRIDLTRSVNGLIMLDLHPIRIGQPKYVELLETVIRYGSRIGGWFPTVSEALRIRRTKGEGWDGHEFCCLLTGDIDNFYFRDYLKRLT